MTLSIRLLVSAAACLMLSGCAPATSSVVDDGEAAAALRTAAERTLGVDSFHADVTFQAPSGSGPGTVDYQAPDREHLRNGKGKDANEVISIGDTIYIDALKRGYFWRIEGRGIGAADTLAYLRSLERAENVRLDGRLYRFDLLPAPDGPGEGTTNGVATLTDDGLIDTLLYHFQIAGDEVSVGFVYGGYDSGITVEPPPADLIVKQTPAIACPSPMPPVSGGLPNGIDFCDVVTTPMG
jgi:hypothetical protein